MTQSDAEGEQLPNSAEASQPSAEASQPLAKSEENVTDYHGQLLEQLRHVEDTINKFAIRKYCTRIVDARINNSISETPSDAWLNAELRERGCPDTMLERWRKRIHATPLHYIAETWAVASPGSSSICSAW
jgi:hypothetical protein